MERPSRHHVYSERRWYKTPLEKYVRNHFGMLVPLYLEPHKELHAKTPPPPKPNQRLLLMTAKLLDDLPNSTLSNQPAVIREVAEAHLHLNDKLAQRIGENFMQQLEFIDAGYYHQGGEDA